jgi:ribosomal protein L11 methyltransferase
MSAANAASSPATELIREPWWEVSLPIALARAEDAAALLVDAGAMGAQILSAAAFCERAWQGHASMGPRGPRNARDRGAPLGEQAEDEQYLVASFEHALPAEQVRPSVAEALMGLASDEQLARMTVACRNDAAWAHAWKEHFKPLKVGRSLWVVPRWDTRFLPPFGSTVLSIDPGMAFGTGQHATTALCLKAIERRCQAARALGQRPDVLDVGAGSGILALAALALGAARATLVDIDEEARVACRENLAGTPYAARAQVAGELPPAAETYDLVVANILAGTLIDMMPALLARLAPRGTLLLSGILADQADAVSQAVFAEAKRTRRTLPATTRLQHGTWVALSYGAPLDEVLARR